VGIFIFNEHGELYVQKRSSTKRHNPNLQDKSIGGHILYGDTPDYTVMVETVQELQVPSIVLRTDKDFVKTHRLLKSYLDTVAIIKHVDTKIWELIKIFDGEEIKIADRYDIYFGVYHGRVKTVDREAKGVLTYSLSELEEEIKEFPKLFTNDLVVMLGAYRRKMESFVEKMKVN
jgi:isopentenyldiphosphate isomerase